MGLKVGIIGLPNAGKSTIFNALTQSEIPAENYPFCTIDPNVGIVNVQDHRLYELADIFKPEKITPATIEFVDIAGLVKGASHGEGLGNQFLGQIRQVDAIAHMLRCFESTDIAHTTESVDPISDAEIVETELMLADLESLERRVNWAIKRARGGDLEAKDELARMGRALAALREGIPVRHTLTGSRLSEAQKLGLLTAKPVLYVCNVDEAAASTGNTHSARVGTRAAKEGIATVVISAAIEAEIATIDDAADQSKFLASLGLTKTGLDRVITAGYALLQLITFFTAGPKEAHAWTITNGALAAKAAGRVHTDMERGFIRAETISYDDFIAYNGEFGARESGKLRLEGRDYAVRDGDVLLFRFNV